MDLYWLELQICYSCRLQPHFPSFCQCPSHSPHVYFKIAMSILPLWLDLSTCWHQILVFLWVACLTFPASVCRPLLQGDSQWRHQLPLRTLTPLSEYLHLPFITKLSLRESTARQTVASFSPSLSISPHLFLPMALSWLSLFPT